MKNQIEKLVRNGLHKEAITLYSQLLRCSTTSDHPNNFTFPFLFKACANLKSIPQAQIIHTHLIKTGFQSNPQASTSLFDTYIKLNLLDDAVKAFDEITQPNIVSLNSAISGFSKHGWSRESLQVFKSVCAWNLTPDSYTISSLLSGCENLEKGVQFHCWAIKIGADCDIYPATSILTMYLVCGALEAAARMFGFIENKNVVCYNAYFSGILRNGDFRAVMDVFKEMIMLLPELRPNALTLVFVISACANLRFLQFGRQVHGFVMKMGMSCDTMAGTAMVDMYSKCTSWQCAYDVFKGMGSNKSLITWNSVISGMMLNDQIEIAIDLFARLESEGLKPDSSTWNSIINGFSRIGRQGEAIVFFRKMLSTGVTPSVKSVTSLLSACSLIAAQSLGSEIHAYVVRTGMIRDEYIVTALIDMYMSCGESSAAHRAFNLFELIPDDPALWNAMISGYGRNGDVEAAFGMFHQMVKNNIQPNSATFNCLLSACSHAGEVEKACEVFGQMITECGLKPTSAQLNVMVDLLGRSGRLNEARELLREIQDPSTSVLASLLGAAKFHSDHKLGEEMAEKLSVLEPENPTPLVMLSNIYAGLGKWENAERIRNTMDAKKLKKVAGISLTELKEN